MATQQDPLKKLYDVVSSPELGLYSKSYEEFKEKYSTEEEVEKMYSIITSPELQLYSKDLKSFKEQYFPNLGKQSEVSGQGSKNTSQTSTEPSQPSQSIRDLDQLAPESVIVSEATPEDYRLAEQGLRRVLVDVPVVGLGDTNLTRKAEFIIPEFAVTSEPTLTEVTTDGKIDYVLKYTDEDGAEQIVAERVPEVVTDKGMGSDALNSLYAGLSQVNAILASIPEFLYNVAAVPQNLIADVVENYAGEEAADLLRPSYSYVSQGKYNPLNWLSKYANQQRQLSEEFNAQMTQFENDIVGSLAEGKYSDAGRQILNTTIQSAPSMLLMAMTGGAGSALRLGTIGRSTAMAIPFASGAFQEIDESTPENVRVLYSIAKGFNEILYEEAFGTLPILRQLGAKVLDKPAMKEIVEGYMRAALSKNGIPASIMKGSLSEMATAFSNEVVDVYGLRIKDAIDWRMILNEGIVGSVADGSLSALNFAIPDRSKRQRADELQSQITAVMQDIDNATSENQVQVLEKTLESKVAELDAIVAESVDLPKPVKDQLTEIASQEQEIELMLQSENVSEESKVALQEQLVNLDNQKQQILNEQQTQSETTQETTEVPVESGEVASVGTEAQQTQELVTEGLTEGVTDVQQTDSRNQEQVEGVRDGVNESLPPYIHVTEGGRRIITKEDISSNFPKFANRVTNKFSNAAWDSSDIRDAISWLVSQKPMYAAGMVDMIDSLIEAETLLSELGQPANTISKSELLDKIQKNTQYSSSQKEILSGIVERLHGDAFFDFTTSAIEGSENGYSFSQNLLAARDADAFIHEVGHWGFYNLLSPEQRVSFLNYVKDRFYGTGRSISDDNALSHNTFSDGSELITNSTANFSEYFAEQFRQYVLTGQTDAQLRSLFDRFKQYLFEIIGFFRDKGYNKDLKPFFDTIISEQASSVQQTEVFVPTEQDVQVSSELSTPTFFQTLSDSEARKARLAELRQRLSDSFKQDQNLGIANDPRTRAERDAQFLRDLTELAILAIADGTVKTAQAFKNFVGNVGDFSEDIINRAFYNAQEVAQSYIDSNPQRTSEAIEDVFTRMQDVSRTRGNTKVTSSQVRQLTDGGTKGRESMTARQALSHQIKTLNRGARDMAKNVRELAGTIQAYIESQKERFKGVKFTSTELRSIARQVSGIVNESRLEKALAVVDKALENAGFRAKLGKIESLQNRVKRASKSKRMPQGLGKTIRDFADINPRDLNDVAQIEEYHGMLESISKLGVKPSGVSVEAMRQMIDIANANNEISRQERAERREQKLNDPEWQAEQIKKKTKELMQLGFEEDMIDALLDPTKPFEEVMKGLEEAMASMKQTRKDVIRDTANKLLRNIQENIDNIYSQMSPSDARNLREFLEVLNIDHIQDNQLMGLNYVLNNILNNGDIQGLGRFKAMAIAQKKAADTNLRQKALGNLRKIGEFADSLRKKFFATLDIRREAIFKDSRLAGIVDNFFGFQAYNSGMIKVQRELKALQVGVDAIIRKYTKGNKNYWQDSYENAMAGVYAIVAQYRRSWTPEQIQENYVGRIKAVVESLDRLRNEAALTGRKKYDPTIKVLEKVVANIADVTRDSEGNIETVEPKMTLDQMWNELGEGHKEYYNYARDWFEANKEEFFTVTRMFSNEVIEDDWVNYFPMSYLDYTKTEEYGSGARADVDLTEIINGFNLRSTTNNLSGAGTARTIEGDMLPRHKIFNFDLLGNFEREAGKILADIYTLEDKWVLNNMTDVRNNGLIGTPDQPAGFEVQTALTYRQLVAERIEADQNFLKRGGRPQDKSTLAIWARVMGTTGVIRALGGYAQWVKQSSPLIEVSARIKNQKSLLLAMQIRAGFNTGDLDVSNIMSRANVQLRADQESLFNLPNKTRSINAEVEKSLRGLAKDLGLKYEDFLTNSQLSKFSLSPLVESDRYYAEIGWLALYIDHVTDGGNKKLDLSEVNEDAVSYANHTNNVVMNTSETGNQGAYAESWLRLFQPMLGFSINSGHALLIAGSKLRDAKRNGDNEGVKRYSAEVLGNFANVVAFGAISWGVRTLGILGGKLVTEGLIELTEDDEEREKELLEKVDKIYGRRLLLNDARSINYIATDLITRGVFSDAVNPLMGALTESLGVQQFLFGEEELRDAGYTYKPFNSTNPNPYINALETYAPVMGVQGMGLTATIGAVTNIVDAFQTHEDFIRRTRGFSDYEGKNILVEYADLTPEGIDKFGIPKYMQYSNYINGVMALSTIFGISDQTASSMVRNSKTAIKQIVKEDRGLVRTGEWEKRLMNARKSFNDIEVDGVKLELTADEQRKYTEMYLKEAVRRDKMYSHIKEGLTLKEYHDVVSEVARGVVKAQILKDYKDVFRDKAKVEAKIQQEDAMWRQRVVELNKKADQK